MLASSQTHRVLIVEDDQDLRTTLSLHIADLNAEVDTASDGEQGLLKAQHHHWDLIILDIQMPKKSGLEVCQTLRSNGNLTPIIMLTARNEEFDRVLGLEMGADDYLIKPFSILELQARVRALWRRLDQKHLITNQSQDIRFETLRISQSTRRAFILETSTEADTEQELDLTTREFDLLWFFMNNPNQVFSREQLLTHIWGTGFNGFEHTVNSHINRLRNKLKQQYIQTVWGVGYRFVNSEVA